MALLVGLNYKHNPDMELKSSYNNVLLFEQYLIKEQEFDKEHIIVITDLNYDGIENNNGSYFAIIKCIKDMVHLSTKNDSLFFYFSGHGLELDNSDNTINTINTINNDDLFFPADFKKNVLTKELFKVLFNKTEASIFSLFDCFNSNNYIDLKYSYSLTPYVQKNKLNTPEDKQNIICIFSHINKEFEKILPYIKGTVRWYSIFTYHFIKILTDDIENYTTLIKILKDDIILQKCSISVNKLKYLNSQPFKIHINAPELPTLTPQEENHKIKTLEREIKHLKKSFKNMQIVNKRYKAAYNGGANNNPPFDKNFSSLLYSLHKK